LDKYLFLRSRIARLEDFIQPIRSRSI
jgi:hypothetical protein